MREHQTADVFGAVVPVEVDPSDDEQFTALLSALEGMANSYVLRQWDGAQERPASLKNFVSEWMLTDKIEEIEEFQPAHDCVACRAGNDQARTFLRENPGRWVALANLHYTEVWET